MEHSKHIRMASHALHVAINDGASLRLIHILERNLGLAIEEANRHGESGTGVYRAVEAGAQLAA